MAFDLTLVDLEPLLLGGAFFGSGGGGTIESARHLASQFREGSYYPCGSVRVVSVEEVTEGEAVMVAYLGAPEAINSAQYPSGPVLAVQNLQARLAEQGRKIAYIVPPESGALGFVVACLVAAKLGLAVIDGDGAGRAVPSLPMLTFAAQQIPPRPAFLVSQGGLSVELDVKPRDGDNGAATHQRDVSAIVEQMIRPIVGDPEFGQFGGLAIWAMTPPQLKKALPITGTLSRALALGRAIQRAELDTPAAMIRYLAQHCHLTAYAVSEPGELVSAEVDTKGGFDVGKIGIRGARSHYTVMYQNESLLAWNSDYAHPVALAPDSIAYFVEGQGQNIFTNGDLVMADGSLNPAVSNRKVTLLAWEAQAQLTEAGGLILESFLEQLNALGYLGPYVPVGSLNQTSNGEAS